jgi:hypothetical protein
MLAINIMTDKLYILDLCQNYKASRIIILVLEIQIILRSRISLIQVD